MAARRPNVADNTSFLTVAICREKLMQIDEDIEKHGFLTRLVECREFFERHLRLRLKKRESKWEG